MYSRIQYISQGATAAKHLQHITAVLEAGCKWIQLRMKGYQDEEILNAAKAAMELCEKHKATFIVNDHVSIAKAVKAHGVHLGLQDTSIAEARKVLGNDKIIGGTANTLEDVMIRIEEGCNYMGVGPFRFTNTKKNLSPVLGTKGYIKIISSLHTEQNKIPIYAIGGITENDVSDLMKTGIYGIALSGALAMEDNKKEIVERLNHLING